MSNTTIKTQTLRDQLTYGREGFEYAWRNIFAERAPADYTDIPTAKALEFVRVIAQPMRGRPAKYSMAAINLLSSMEGKQTAVPTADAPPVKCSIAKKTSSGIEFVLEQMKKNEEFDQNNPEKPGSFTLAASVPVEVVEQVEPDQSITEQPAQPMKAEQPEQPPVKSSQKLDIEPIEIGGIVVTAFQVFGLCRMFGFWGAAFSVVLIAVIWQAIRSAKNSHSANTASTVMVLVWIIELLMWFVDLSMFNLAVWSSKDSLPIEIGQGSAVPFSIAVCFSTFFTFVGAYAPQVRLSLTKEAVEAENYEKTYNLKY